MIMRIYYLSVKRYQGGGGHFSFLNWIRQICFRPTFAARARNEDMNSSQSQEKTFSYFSSNSFRIVGCSFISSFREWTLLEFRTGHGINSWSDGDHELPTPFRHS